MTTGRRGLCGTLLAAVVVVQGCNQLLGVEEAYVDPSLSEQETSSGGLGTESTASGGSGGTGGQSDDDDEDPGAAGAREGGKTNQGTSTSASSAGSNSTGAMGMGGGPTSGGTTSSGAGGTGSKPASLCDTYCDDVMEYCTDADLQYRDRAQCMVICEMLPEGQLGEVGENSAGCRAKYAAGARYLSGTEQSLACRRAGPGGDGACGSNCEGFCTLMMQVCAGQQVGVYQFETEEACLDACATLPDADTGYSASEPTIADGNHVQCRLFHVTSGAMLDAEEHCEHSMGVTLCEAPEDS